MLARSLPTNIAIAMPGSIIIFSLTFHPFVGGAEVAIKEITARLPDRRFLLITARLRSDLSQTEQIGSNLSIFRVGKGHWSDKYLYPWYATRQARQLIRQQPVFLCWAMMANYALIAAYFACFGTKNRYLLTEQSGDSDSFIRNRTWFWAPLYRLMYRRAVGVQSISKSLAVRARQMGFRGEPQIIPNGVDLTVFCPIQSDERTEQRQRLGYQPEQVVIVTTSRLVFKNAIDDLLQAMNIAIYKMGLNLSLAIVGDGAERKKLEFLTERLGLVERVRFFGHLDQPETVKIMQASDIFCRPSRSEGLGNSFLEAMAMGLPIIATEVGGIVDFLRVGENGLSCQPDKPASIAQAIEILSKNSEEQIRLGQNGQSLVRQTYDWDQVSRQMDNLFAVYVKD